MSDRPEPPIPSEVDLRGMPCVMIDRERLRGSDFNLRATDAEFRAGVWLWLEASQQVPAGSLPSDDMILTGLAGLGRELKAWKRVKAVALHGFYICSDDRYYHKVVAQTVLEAWIARLGRKKGGFKGNASRWGASSEMNVGDMMERARAALQTIAPSSPSLRGWVAEASLSDRSATTQPSLSGRSVFTQTSLVEGEGELLEIDPEGAVNGSRAQTRGAQENRTPPNLRVIENEAATEDQVAQCCHAAGSRLVYQDYETVNGWLRDGLKFDEILKVIRARRNTMSKAPDTLAYFGKVFRDYQANKSKTARPKLAQPANMQLADRRRQAEMPPPGYEGASDA